MHGLTAKLTWPWTLALATAAMIGGGIISKSIFGASDLTHQLLWFTYPVFALKLLLEFHKKVGNFSTTRKSGKQPELSALLPAGLVGRARLELAQLSGFLRWVLKLTGTAKPNDDGDILEFYRKSQYSTVFVIVLLSCLTDGPISALVLNIAVQDPVQRQFIHWVVITGLLYTVVWLFADRHLLKSTHHVAATQALHLRVGARFAADIPWAAITDIHRIKKTKELTEPRDSWLRNNEFNPSETVQCTPFDQPNVAVVLRPEVPVHIEKGKTRRQNVRWVLIYVDDPNGAIEVLRQRWDASVSGSGQMKD